MIQKTLHLVDPELVPILRGFTRPPLSETTLPALREMALPILEEPSEAGRRVQAIRFNVPGPQDAPEVGVIVYRPPSTDIALPCIFHIHGGGYILGKAGQREAAHRDLAASLHCAIVTVDYRLAPETPFPGAINDCYAALQWLFAEAPRLDIDATRIGVAGESAGGGLAAALALMVRDRGEHNLTFQHLIYPMLDDRTGVSGSPHPQTGEFIWTAQDNAFAWGALLGCKPGGKDVSPYAAAARAQDLSRLPATFISTGALDLFVEEDIDYARRLSRAGVSVELHVYPGAFHGFEISPTAGIARLSRANSKAALERALKKPAGHAVDGESRRVGSRLGAPP
ncbi:MAG TPA: alpha/beta hydrolase [Xanthobacteraceae bacterium]|jgi:triacylglycerol lipase